MNRDEVENYIDTLSPQERKKYVKSLSNRSWEYQSVINKHLNYLESIPTKESKRITNEYYERKNIETGINEIV